MKQKEKEQFSLPTEATKFTSKLQVNTTDKPSLTGSNKQGEELIQKDEVNNTPFVIITINNESFGAFGKFRITEMFHTKQQCKTELLRMDWNNIVKIMTLVVELMNTKNNK